MSEPSTRVVAEKGSGSDTECEACSWTKAKQERCSYSSHVKLFYGASNRGAWAIGSAVILKERPDLYPRNEVKNTEFVRQHTTIPVPKVLREWVDDSSRYFVLTERISGETLQDAWSALSGSQKENIATQVADCIHQLRRFQSPVMKSVDDGPLYSGWLFLNGSETPHGPIKSDKEMGESLISSLHIPETASSRFMRRLPTCTPYTLTHGDLNIQNIVVKDGELAGILDWEYAGYFPAWWEYVATKIGLSAEDAEWKALLGKRLDPFDQAVEFWLDFYSLSLYPNLDERGQTLLNVLVQDD
ncbi:kinase-like protein [Aspergillus granulosus]|uniref:Kinase-like protein n=1 Tax=Aspergillus granulosus TaxID=176169 RepID=A0ABR4HG00_9EURO